MSIHRYEIKNKTKSKIRRRATVNVLWYRGVNVMKKYAPRFYTGNEKCPVCRARYVWISTSFLYNNTTAHITTCRCNPL